MTRILVTGGSGFIGRHLVKRLVLSGRTVRVLARAQRINSDAPLSYETIVGDLQNHDALKLAVQGCDTVFHLAAKVHVSIGRSSDYDYAAVNIDGTRNLLKAAVSAGVKRFVLFSTVKAIGEESHGLNETSIPRPSTDYGKSKLAAEYLTLEYGRRYGFHVSILRLPLVYGIGAKGNLVSMIKMIDQGLFPPLSEVGNRRSVCHVTNAVNAAIMAATAAQANGQCYVVVDARSYSTRELYELLCKGLGKSIPKWQPPFRLLKTVARVGDVIGQVSGRRFLFDSDVLDKLTGSAWYSSEKITRELGYKPAISFEEALPELIAWYRKSQA